MRTRPICRPLYLAGRSGKARPLLIAVIVVLALFVLALVLPGTEARREGEGNAAANATGGKIASAAASSNTTTTTATTAAATAANGQMRVHFLDVAQGHATLFEIGGQVLIIDGGGGDRSSFVVAYLKNLGIQQVDVMVASHYDSDHISGLVGVLNVFPVKQVYDAAYTTDTRVYNSFKSIIRSKGISEDVPGMRQTIQAGEANVTFVAPREYGHSDENDDSIGVRVVFGETSFLIMGDSSADAEQQILNQDLTADVFLAAHHGSNGSTSRTLLDKVKPSFAVISCGAGNSYGHPGDNTLGRLKATGAALYRTDRQGTIVCTSDGRNLTWDKPPCNDFTPGTAAAAAVTPSAVTSVPPSPASQATSATAKPTPAVPTPTPTATDNPRAYVLNTNTKKIHFPSCGSAASILPKNRRDVVDTRSAIIAQGYSPCGNCKP